MLYKKQYRGRRRRHHHEGPSLDHELIDSLIIYSIFFCFYHHIISYFFRF